MKVFNEKQTAAILKKAAANSRKDPSSDLPGLTADELKQIASDSGIDPAEINKAIAEIDVGDERPDRTIWGGPFSFFEQIEIDHEISALEWEKMLVLIRDFFQSKGEISTRESVFEWSSPRGTTNSAQITALKEHGKTKISIGWSGPLTALPFYLPLPLVGIASLFFASEFLELSAVPGLLFVIAAIGLTFSAGRWALRGHLDKGFSKLEKLAATLKSSTDKNEEPSKASIEKAGIGEIQSIDARPLLNLDQEENQLAKVDNKITGRSRE
ncbi:MAG: hypothetical protein AB8G77_18865 [Rhodothermales bacterium]